MIHRVRFFSDTNRQHFMLSLDERNMKFREAGDDVYAEEWPPWAADLAQSLNGFIVEQDEAYQTTSGLEDAGFQNTGAFSTRSNPPDVSRGTEPPDYSDQIVSQQPKLSQLGRWPQKRSTRSQP